MSSLSPRLLPGLALLLLPLAGCGDEDPVPAGERPLVVQPDNPDVADAVEDPSAPRIISVVVEDGEKTGDTGVVELKRNVPVRLVVVSDEAGTLLVEGYGFREVVTADVPVQLEFLADEPGDFRVLLEESGVELTRLRVA